MKSFLLIGIINSILLIGITFSPILIEILLVVNLFFLVYHGIAQIYMGLRKPHHLPVKNLQKEPFISVHIPICSEPPALVCKTIASVLQQKYDNFEVIVLDNNTTDSKLWKPVSDYCNSIKNNVRFFHYEQVEGYKAGALNICRQLSDERTDYIFTVDADYVLDKDCLKKAILAVENENIALVQFPQCYRNVSSSTWGLQEEYKHFFNIYAEKSNSTKSVLGTGTLSLINVAALDAVGGWHDVSITEDAELGMRFQHAGFQTSYSNQCVGKGIMPIEVESLRKQRIRWIFGNFQTLLNSIEISKMFGKDKIALESWLQLTAWSNLCGLPILALLVAFFSALFLQQSLPIPIVQLAVGSLYLFLVFKYILFGISTEFDFRKHHLAFLTHVSLFIEGAFSWWETLIGAEKPFVRTNKFSKKSSMSKVQFLYATLFVAIGVYLLSIDVWQLAYLTISLGLLYLLSSAFLVYQINQSNKILVTQNSFKL